MSRFSPRFILLAACAAIHAFSLAALSGPCMAHFNDRQAEQTRTGNLAQSQPDLRRDLLQLHAVEIEHTGRDELLRFHVDETSRTAWREMSTRQTARMDVQLSTTELVTLELQRFEVISSRTRFVSRRDGIDQDVALPDVLLLRGRVVDQPSSHAFLAITDRGGGSGSITLGDGRRFELHSQRTDVAERDALVLGRAQGGFPPVEEFCQILHDDACCSHGGLAGDDGEVDPLYRGPRVLSIAVDSDHAYFQLFDNEEDALSYIVQLIGAVSDVFLRDLDFHLILGFARVWPEGGEPFAADDLGGFREWWHENMDMRGLNLVHLFSGRRNLPYGGVAYLAHACSDSAFAISGFLNGNFPPPSALHQPHLGIWDLVVVSHEIGHNLGTLHTHSYDPPIDSCASGPGNEKRGTIMSYCHTLQGGILNTDLRFHVLVQQFIETNHLQEEVDCLWHDCNGNGVPDDVDIADGTSIDLDSNGIPDECETCTAPGVLNSVAIAEGAADVNGNGVPDSCEDDCTGSGVPNEWQIALGISEDLNGNNIPDQCEPDCLGNGVPNFLEILLGEQEDIDRNAVPDACQDCNNNGQPDWIDVERQHHLYVGVLDPAAIEGGMAVREYHRDSGVLVQAIGEALPPGHDPGGLPVRNHGFAFGADRQIYMANVTGNNILKLNVDTGESSIFIESGAGGLAEPTSIAFGPDGALYVASRATHSVLRFDPVTGAFVDQFVTSGSGGLHKPNALAFSPSGSLLVATPVAVLEYDGSNGAFTRVFTNEGIDQAATVLCHDDGRVFVVNGEGNNITHYQPDGQSLGVFNDEFPLSRPWGAAFGPDGMLYVTHGIETSRVIAYCEDGRYRRAFVRGDALLVQPTAVAFRPASDQDLNQTGLPDECDVLPPKSCPADLDASGSVGVSDLLIVLSAWGSCPVGPDICIPDLTGDAQVGVADLLELLAAWGECP